MNFKPFYVKTKNLSRLDILNLRKVAIESGAEEFSELYESIMDYGYVGVDYENDFIAYDEPVEFSPYKYKCEAVELTYEQAIAHMKGEASASCTKEQEILALKKELQELKDSILCERKELKQKLSLMATGASNWCNRWKGVQSLNLFEDYGKSENEVINLIGYYEGLEEAYIEAKLLVK